MTAQAGAVAYIDLADTPYGRGWTTSHEPLQMPVGRYLHESAAVPVEALEGLVKAGKKFRAAQFAPHDYERSDAYSDLAAELDRIERLIKERSNG